MLNFFRQIIWRQEISANSQWISRNDVKFFSSNDDKTKKNPLHIGQCWFFSRQIIWRPQLNDDKKLVRTASESQEMTRSFSRQMTTRQKWTHFISANLKMNVSGSVCRLGGQREQKVLKPKFFQYENRTTMVQDYFESVPRVSTKLQAIKLPKWTGWGT